MLGERVARDGERRDWHDLGFTVILKPEASYAHTHASFTVYEIEGHGADANGDYTVPLFWRKGSNSNIDPVEDPDLAESFLECSIKWDGCSSWYPAENWHLCGREYLDNAVAMMQRVWEWAKELNLDRLDDDVTHG